MLQHLLRGALVVLLTVAAGCLPAQENPLADLIESLADSLPWTAEPARYQIEVIYTRIDRPTDGAPRLTTYRWGPDSTDYYYPASTVKLPIAVLALQHLNELGVIGMDAATPMFHGKGLAPASAPQGSVERDSSSATGLPTVGHYVRRIFLTSDNDAYNRLFEWLGPDYINKSLHAAGIHGSRILHRVGVEGFDPETHRYLNPVRFADGYQTLYQNAERYDPYYDPLPGVTGQQRGTGHTVGDSLVNGPFDFSRKNYLSLRNLHDILLRVVVPEAVSDTFQLTEGDYALLRRAMSERPRESDYPHYAEPDNYVKFWIYGDRGDDVRIPDEIRILNKVGWAYGYLTDVAYITDGEVEFILAGRILSNANGIFNDGQYEYDEVGMPFFGRLGRAMLEFERGRPR